ncbi:hypothetical protein [Pseudonocardia alni]|uniref:hypothetical protein n=1 Tax=Pseudonocardia alni TaxID=33907 RepID=UPI00280A7171|nr:hypothetical protein [Pseudonocardia alni]
MPGSADEAAGSPRVTAPGGGSSPRRRDRARSGAPEGDGSAAPASGDAGSAPRTGPAPHRPTTG